MISSFVLFRDSSSLSLPKTPSASRHLHLRSFPETLRWRDCTTLHPRFAEESGDHEIGLSVPPRYSPDRAHSASRFTAGWFFRTDELQTRSTSRRAVKSRHLIFRRDLLADFFLARFFVAFLFFTKTGSNRRVGFTASAAAALRRWLTRRLGSHCLFANSQKDAHRRTAHNRIERKFQRALSRSAERQITRIGRGTVSRRPRTRPVCAWCARGVNSLALGGQRLYNPSC